MSTATSTPQSQGIVTRLSVMMFLQFFVWGAWFTTAGACLANYNLGAAAGGTYGGAPIAAIIAPLFLGLIADRLFASEKIMAVLMLIGGVIMCAMPGAVQSGDANLVVWLATLHLICYMPTLGLSNTIAFSNIPSQNDFPRIRVWGTIGWISAGLLCGFMGWSLSVNIFWLAGIASFLFGFYSFTLPHTPPPAKNQPLDFRALFMVDAFKMFKDFPFAIFILCSTLVCVPLAYYYGITAQYLTSTGFEQPASSMTLGQMSEIVFMLLIPFFLRRLGVKVMILVGMLAWVLRYALFAMGAPDQVVWMLFAAIILHGICYDFFFVTGFIYTDKKAPRSVRGQAQSMLVFFTQGVGMFVGYKVAFSQFGQRVPDGEALLAAISEARPAENLTFLQSMGKMFSVNMPAVDGELLTRTMQQWQAFWWVPAGMAAGIAVLFLVTFWDPKVDDELIEPVEESSAK